MRKFTVTLAASTILAMSTPAMAQDQGTAAFRVELGGDSAETGVPASYAWLENIGACSTTCGTGTRQTTYQCQNIADFNYTSGGYGAPEDEAYCTHSEGAKPADQTSSCTVYSGCSYDWVNPPVEETPIALGSNPVGRVGCGYVNEVFSPYCQRSGGGTNVILGATDHEFCSGDRPDYDNVASGDPDALGYDRNVTQTNACTTTDHDWQRGAWGPWSSTCSATATRTRTVTCERRFDGTTQDDSNCDQSEDHAAVDIRPVYSGCSYERGTTITNTGPWEDACATNTSRTLTYNCLRSDGTTVAANECTSRSVDLTQTETGSNYAGCSYEWTPNDTTTGWGASSNTCSSSATQTRTVTCQRSNGDTVADSSCSGAKPATTRTVEDYSTCSYARGTTVTNTGPWANGCSSNTSRTLTYNCRRSDGTDVAASECTSRGVDITRTETGSNYASCSYAWNTTGWGPSSNTCTSSATQTRSVTCRRSNGDTVSDSNCSGARPASSRTIADYSSCSYARGAVTNTGNWASSCSSNTSRTLTHACRRSDGTNVSSSECSSRGVSLTTTETGANYSGCSYAWNTGGWGPSSNRCTSSATQTRSVTCRRSDGTTVSDGSCSGTKPASSRTIADYSACNYSRGTTITNTGPWASSCSSSTSRTLTYNCLRSDGTSVSASECTNRSVSLTQTQTGSNYSGCTYAWNASGWGPSSSTCSSSATQTRSVTCRRSNGSTVADSSCSGTKPASSRTVADYSSCSYTWSTGSWSASSNRCSSSATQTRSVNCRRSDGTHVSDSSCSGTKPATSRTVADYSACTYSWQAGSWGASSSTCSSSATQTRSVYCRRSNGSNVADSNCSGTKPASSRTVADYSSCSYSWQTGSWSAYSSTCSTSATRTRSVYCRRSNGSTVPDSNCSGTRPASSQTTAVYSGCSYSWQTGSWGAYSSTCSSSATQTRSVYCRRNGVNQTVSDGNCSGTKPASSRTVADYSSCSYSWQTGSWSAYSSTCSTSATRTRSVYCRRSNGSTVPDSNCSGTRPASSQTTAVYSGCSYSWQTGSWGAYSSTCSSSATQTRSVYCRRNGVNQTVSDGNCSGTKPSGSRTVANYSGCSYSRGSSTGSSWNSTCSTNATRTTTYACRRSDGTNVSGSECTSRSISLTTTSTGANYTGCTYTPIYGSWSACASPGTQSRTMTSCRRNGVNQTVSNSYCTSRGHSATQTQSCTLTPGTGPVLQTNNYGGGGSYCLGNETIQDGQSGFPSWCRSLGGKHYQRISDSCERTNDRYGPPWEEEGREICRAY